MARGLAPAFTTKGPDGRPLGTLFLAGPKSRARSRLPSVLKRKIPRKVRTTPSPPHSIGTTSRLYTHPGTTHDERPPLADTGKSQLAGILPRIGALFQSALLRPTGIENSVSSIDLMDKILEDSDRERMKLINKLCKACSRKGALPKSMCIPDRLTESSKLRSEGGTASVLEGTYEGRRVAVKVLRVHAKGLEAFRSRFCREAIIWKHLKHQNILPLLGVTISECRFATVSEWMENGNINEFIQKDRRANGTWLLVGAVNGLMYMHKLHMVHGDLKGSNILINQDRHACISDFGLSTITGVGFRPATNDPGAAPLRTSGSQDTLVSFTGGGTTQWMSPELHDPGRFGVRKSEAGRPTIQSDCYALGMVIYEVLCGHAPYHDLPGGGAAMLAIVEGDRPRKPEGAERLGFTKELWETVEKCWLTDRKARPSAGLINSRLSDAVPFWSRRGSSTTGKSSYDPTQPTPYLIE